jgi:hypothetical protein
MLSVHDMSITNIYALVTPHLGPSLAYAIMKAKHYYYLFTCNFALFEFKGKNGGVGVVLGGGQGMKQF